MLEYVAGALENLSPDERHVFVPHLEARNASDASDPFVSIDFLAEFEKPA